MFKETTYNLNPWAMSCHNKYHVKLQILTTHGPLDGWECFYIYAQCQFFASNAPFPNRLINVTASSTVWYVTPKKKLSLIDNSSGKEK